MLHPLHPIAFSKIMRKLLFIIMLASVLALNAKETKTSLPLAFGVSYNHAFKNNQHGWAAKLQADLGHRFRLEPEMMYFAVHDGVSTLDLNLNLHYRMRLFDGFAIYPFIGVNYSHWGYDGPNASRWGANLGCGAEYRISHRLSLFTEARLQFVSHETQPLLGAGLKYHF